MTLIECPAARPDWEVQQAALRARLWHQLGDLPPTVDPQPTLLSRTLRDGCIVEQFVFDNGADAQVYGYLLLPPNLTEPAPAILYQHLHGFKYGLGKDELFHTEILGFAPGPALVRAGYVVLAIDAYSFGERQTYGPAGETETGPETEQALFKHFLWHGASLWGMIIRDDQLALNYLLSRPEVDPARVSATGMSMGGSRTTWLGALDDRLRVIVPVAQMTRYRDFAATGRYNLHGIYYYVPGMLRESFDMEHLAALAAPRPQAIVIGDQDPLSPMTGVTMVADYARQVYALFDAADRLQLMIELGTAHKYTPTMFANMLNFINHHTR